MRPVRPWERLRVFARKHGADLVSVPHRDLHEKTLSQSSWAHGLYIQYAPFTKNLAIEWIQKKVFIADDCLGHQYVVGAAIHELGHILAVKDRPAQAEEENFLGWEWQVSKLCDLRRQYQRSMRDYMTPTGMYFQILTQSTRMNYFRASVVRGQEYGNINEDGEPIAVR